MITWNDDIDLQGWPPGLLEHHVRQLCISLLVALEALALLIRNVMPVANVRMIF